MLYFRTDNCSVWDLCTSRATRWHEVKKRHGVIYSATSQVKEERLLQPRTLLLCQPLCIPFPFVGRFALQVEYVFMTIVQNLMISSGMIPSPAQPKSL
jgi:hypothetical protein